ncbi:MAG: lipopolysaccharide heptosyltransferase II [Smithellaceae bacterium]|nr:lipopolysaccharide heptosyltransferase II [Smithellaceae bacterium]
MLEVRGKKSLPTQGVRRILIRGTNWIGDVVMTLPAIAAIRRTYPEAHIAVLVKPWVAEVMRICPDVDEVITFASPGRHDGVAGKFRLAGELKERGFDMAILLQNAIEAAIIVRLAGIPTRAGFNSDARGALLTHSVQRTAAIRKLHQIHYYLEMVKALGCVSAGSDVSLRPGEDYRALADEVLATHKMTGARKLIGIAPGATYGPAKKWYPERFAAVADALADECGAHVILFGSKADQESTAAVQKAARHHFLDLAGATNLKTAMALIASCDLFISNDSGLMHVAGALNIPTVAIFGSTNPVATSPVGEKSIVVHRDVPCSPCLKKTCPKDFICMDLITLADVLDPARRLIGGGTQ